MKIMHYGFGVLVACICSGSAVLGQTKQAAPNIIYIMSDDHGWQSISAYGSRLNQTPQLDRLAAEGMLFTRAYVTNALCGPSRAVMLTGKHSHLNGFRDNHSTFNGSRQTVAKILQSAGYQTAVIGKWHLGSDPQGFDYWNILPGQGNYYNPDFIENGTRKQMQGYVTTVTTDLTLQWLQQRDTAKPFFLIYQHKAPHRNWMPEEKYYHLFDSTDFPVPANFFDTYATRTRAAREQEMEIARHMHFAYDLKLAFDLPDSQRKGLGAMWQGIYNRFTPEQKARYRQAYGPTIDAFSKANLQGEALAIWKYRQYMRDYLRCVQSVDDNVGRLLDYLDQSGLSTNTIVIYTSDQGFFLGEHGWFDKRFMYEESFRTPLIVKWPGVTPQQSVSSGLVQNLDFAQTILEMAGINAPSDMQGKSMVPLLKGNAGNHHRKALYYHFYENEEHRVARHLGIRTNRYKLIWFYDHNEWELYDMARDSAEMRNVYGDAAYRKVQRQMLKDLIKLRKSYGDTTPLLSAAAMRQPANKP